MSLTCPDRQRLVEARRMLGWSQSELARRARTTTSNIRDLESGRNGRPAHDLVMAVFYALRDGGLRGLTVEHLFPTDAPATV